MCVCVGLCADSLRCRRGSPRQFVQNMLQAGGLPEDLQYAEESTSSKLIVPSCGACASSTKTGGGGGALAACSGKNGKEDRQNGEVS